LSSLGLANGRIEPILQSSKNFGLNVLGGCSLLSLANQLFGGDQLTSEIGQNGLQPIPFQANLPQSLCVEPSDMIAGFLSLTQA